MRKTLLLLLSLTLLAACGSGAKSLSSVASYDLGAVQPAPNNRIVAETSLKTSGPPKAIRLTADRSNIRADRNDLSYVTVEVVDAAGQRVPDAEADIRFTITGAGELAGQASAAPDRPASFKSPTRKTYQGRCLAILRPVGGAGDITLRAEAEGLESGSVTVKTLPFR